MRGYIRLILIGLFTVLYTMPSWAAFETLGERKEDIASLREREIKQAEDISKMQESMQENNILLKGIIIEMRKQTELLDAINAEQKNQSLDLSRQTELLEKLIKPQE